MRYKLKMNEACENCGLCTGNMYISDESNGLPYVQKSIILEEERETVQKLVENCPVQALSLCELKKKSLEVCRREIADMIANFNLSVPPEKDFCYDKKYANYNLTDEVSEEWEFRYNSREDAKSAGCRSLEKNILSERTNCIRQIINNYSIDKLAPYLQYQECKGNFYYESIQKADRVLYRAVESVVETAEGYPFLEKFTKIDPRVANHDKLSWSKRALDEITGRAYSICSHIRRNSGDSFRSYIDVMEGYKEVKTIFGTHDKTKYAFYGLYKAANEIRDDIDAAVQNNFNQEVQNYVYSEVKSIVTSMEDVLKDAMKEQMDELLGDVEIFIREGKSFESEYFRKHMTIPENEKGDLSEKCCKDLKTFWKQYTLELGNSIRFVDKHTKKEILIAQIPECDSDVSFSDPLYYNEYVILEKHYLGWHRCDFLRVNLLTGKLEIMLKDANEDNSQYRIHYNDDKYAWWWHDGELYCWDAKAGKTKTVMTSYSYWCSCIGSTNKYAYIEKGNDYLYKYTYATGEMSEIPREKVGYNVRIKNGELFYVNRYEPIGLYLESGKCLCKPPYPGPKNWDANNDYVVWLQDGQNFFDRNIYILNRKNNEYKIILSFSVEGYPHSKIYFWLREDAVQVISFDYASYILPSDLCHIINKWTISFDGKINSYEKETLTEDIQEIMHHYQDQYSHHASLPDIFF